MSSNNKTDKQFEVKLNRLHRWLQDAIEIEHATIPPYLTAWLTIMDGHNREAADIIKSVLLEEMLHLTLAANILNAVGGKPNLVHPKFVARYPHKLPHSGGDFEIHIEKFSKQALKTFQLIEKPEARSAKPAGPGEFTSIDQFYAAVSALLKDLCKEPGGEKAVFTGDRKLQIQPEDFYGSGSVVVVHDLKTVEEAVRTIVDQGEGADHGIFDDDKAIFGSGEGKELAHYFRFNEIYNGRRYKAKDKPGKPTGDKIDIDFDKVYPIQKDTDRRKVKDSGIRKALDEFADSYGQLLKALHLAFNGERSQMNQAMARMFAIRNQAQALIRTPINKKETVGLDFTQS